MSAQRVFVESACIASIAFSGTTNILELEFRNGRAYEYFAVPETLVQQLLSAASKGAFVSRFIRGRFRFREVPRQET